GAGRSNLGRRAASLFPDFRHCLVRDGFSSRPVDARASSGGGLSRLARSSILEWTGGRSRLCDQLQSVVRARGVRVVELSLDADSAGWLRYPEPGDRLVALVGTSARIVLRRSMEVGSHLRSTDI